VVLGSLCPKKFLQSCNIIVKNKKITLNHALTTDDFFLDKVVRYRCANIFRGKSRMGEIVVKLYKRYKFRFVAEMRAKLQTHKRARPLCSSQRDLQLLHFTWSTKVKP
jgi:serine/threonine-protein kinase RIO1